MDFILCTMQGVWSEKEEKERSTEDFRKVIFLY